MTEASSISDRLNQLKAALPEHPAQRELGCQPKLRLAQRAKCQQELHPASDLLALAAKRVKMHLSVLQ